MKKYKGIIFDLDGTLLDTIGDLTDSVNWALAKQGYPGYDEQALKMKVGKGFRNLIETSLPEEARTAETIDSVLADFVQIYDQNYMQKTRCYPGIVKMLEALAAAGVRIAVNSNKRTDYTEALIKKLLPGHSFVAVYGEREGIPRKPDPAAALEIAGMMKLRPEEVLYIGDSKTDIQTGQNAGMKTIGVLWGFRDQAELAAQGADWIVGKPEEIIGIAEM